ncbi:MAG: ROK family transcriptional regulator [Actinomycetota bacterium]|nr:ROK family transcriptional regulator [Actinomycetota bacterium]
MVAQRTAARPEQIRQHNLGLVLRHLHQRSELTRSELVEVTGLNRSTIAALVAELTNQGMVTQHRSNAVQSGAGRPSHLVTTSARAVYGLAVDVDVQTATVAAIGLGGQMLARRTWHHQGSSTRPGPVVKRLGQVASELAQELAGGICVGIGVGVPGMVRSRDGYVLNAPNLGWHDVPFGALLRKVFDVPVRCGNDGDLAALAEHQRGAAMGYDNMICIIGRVGVGSGIISAGLPLQGERGYAGEIGHMCIDPHGVLCHCGRRGCLEQYAGEAALLTAARAEGLLLRTLPQLFTAATAGDPAALRAVNKVAHHLAIGTRNLINLLDPQMVVFTGHLADVLSHSRDVIQEAIAQAAVADTSRPVLLTHGSLTEPTLVGAAELAFESLLSGDDGPPHNEADSLPSCPPVARLART